MSQSALSARQKEILGLLAVGKSNKEIAHELHITEGTVKQHLFTLFRKLGVTSRLKATLKADELLKKPLNQTIDDPLGASYLQDLPTDYAWRLVTVVHLQIKDATDPRKFDNERFSQMAKRAQALVALLQGGLTFIPERDIIATFGAPKSHLDDASRALIFTRLLCRFMSERLDMACAVGIATTTALVSFTEEPLYRSDGYNLARDLSTHANAGQILATDLTCKMAGPLFSYRKHQSESSDTRFIVKEVVWNDWLNPTEHRLRVQLPFFNEILTKANTNKTQWVKVKGWPPSACMQLLDIFALHGRARNLRVAGLRLASGLSPEGLVRNLHHQLYLFGLLKVSKTSKQGITQIDGDSQAFLQALEHSAQSETVTLILLYGANSLETFLKITKTCDLTNLSNLPLIIVTTGEIGHTVPELIVELLENHPNPTGKHLSYHLKLPDSLAVPEGLSRDLATLLEMLSPQARRAIYLYTKENKVAITIGSDPTGLEIGKELLVSGLFKLDNDLIVCRDTATLKALERFFAGQ